MFQNFAANESPLNRIIEPDILACEQFFDSLRAGANKDPERRLMLAVLEDAVRAIQKHMHSEKANGRKNYEEAIEWIEMKDSDWLCSFENVCELLGLNPEYLRSGIIKWIAMQKSLRRVKPR